MRFCRLVLVLVILSATSVVVADQYTADSIISAFGLGVPADRLLAAVNNPANSVQPVTSDELMRLRSSGVPEPVIQALLARAPAASAPPARPVPDDSRLVRIVTLVQQGLSEGLIAEQVVRSGEQYPLTVNDLIFLKDNRVPESIIGALMSSGRGLPPAAAGAAATAGKRAAAQLPAEEQVFDGLVLKKGGAFAKNHSGKLVLADDKLQWRDSVDPNAGFELFLKGASELTVTCAAREGGSFCHRVELSFTQGDSYLFEDVKRDVGGNENLMRLLDAVKAKYPKLTVVEKLKK